MEWEYTDVNDKWLYNRFYTKQERMQILSVLRKPMVIRDNVWFSHIFDVYRNTKDDLFRKLNNDIRYVSELETTTNSSCEVIVSRTIGLNLKTKYEYSYLPNNIQETITDITPEGIKLFNDPTINNLYDKDHVLLQRRIGYNVSNFTNDSDGNILSEKRNGQIVCECSYKDRLLIRKIEGGIAYKYSYTADGDLSTISRYAGTSEIDTIKFIRVVDNSTQHIYKIPLLEAPKHNNLSYVDMKDFTPWISVTHSTVPRKMYTDWATTPSDLPQS